MPARLLDRDMTPTAAYRRTEHSPVKPIQVCVGARPADAQTDDRAGHLDWLMTATHRKSIRCRYPMLATCSGHMQIEPSARGL